MLNRATRLASFFLHGDKAYEGDILFGQATDTYDKDGLPRGPRQPVEFSDDQLQEWVDAFRGTITQKVPPHSSIKYRGKPLYYYTRQGISVPIPERSVDITTFHILEWRPPRLHFHIECSGGTYIRSIAEELGQLAGCGAHLTTLRRIRSGPFDLDHSVTLECLLAEPERLAQWIVPLEGLLTGLPAIACDADQSHQVRNGCRLIVPLPAGAQTGDRIRFFDPAGRLLAIGTIQEIDGDQALVHPGTVLAVDS